MRSPRRARCAHPGRSARWRGRGSRATAGRGGWAAGGSIGARGGGERGGGGGGGWPAREPRLYLPQDTTVGPDGRLFVVDWNNHRIRVIEPDGTMRIVAGIGELGLAA